MGAYAPAFWGRPKTSNLQEILQLIQDKYVDAVNTDTLGTTAINEMLSHLDPHSVYIPPSTVKQINEELQGSFEGVGIEYNIIHDTVTVIRCIPEGPAARAGLQSGDQLIVVNDTSLVKKELNSDSIRKYFRGPRGSTVNVVALRGGQRKLFTLQRDVIPAQIIEAAYMLTPSTGYIKLGRFSGNSYELFMEQLEKLQKQGMRELILDLRGNGGGLLDDAVQMADEFLDNNKLIVYTEGKSSPRQQYLAKRPGLFETAPLVVLLDEGSASASEVLAGALQDWDRATIVGTRSFGKGLVQEQFNLSDGGALRLSVTRYYTPLGRSIQKPYRDKSLLAYRDEVNQRNNHTDSTHNSSAQHKGKVFRTANGKILYEGEGITPDYVVSADTIWQGLTERLDDLTENLMALALKYYLQQQKLLTAVSNPAALSRQIQQDERLRAWLANEVAGKFGQAGNLNEAEKQQLLHHFAAMLAHIRWGKEGHYTVLNTTDRVVQKALETLSNQ